MFNSNLYDISKPNSIMSYKLLPIFAQNDIREFIKKRAPKYSNILSMLKRKTIHTIDVDEWIRQVKLKMERNGLFGHTFINECPCSSKNRLYKILISGKSNTIQNPCEDIKILIEHTIADTYDVESQFEKNKSKLYDINKDGLYIYHMDLFDGNNVFVSIMLKNKNVILLRETRTETNISSCIFKNVYPCCITTDIYIGPLWNTITIKLIN